MTSSSECSANVMHIAPDYFVDYLNQAEVCYNGFLKLGHC